MSHSFGFVEDTLREADFFLDHLRDSKRHSFDAKCFFSAFVSAARNVTFAMQASLKGVEGFDEWYDDNVSRRLKTDSLAPYFKEFRNNVIHKGINPLNQVPLEHLRDLFRQSHHHAHSHVLVFPSMPEQNASSITDAVQACTIYLSSLVSIVHDCYQKFKTIVDPKWYFTEENFAAMNRTFEDAVVELGFPKIWAACAPSGTAAWEVLRSQQPACQINDIFKKYLGKTILSPDELLF